MGTDGGTARLPILACRGLHGTQAMAGRSVEAFHHVRGEHHRPRRHGVSAGEQGSGVATGCAAAAAAEAPKVPVLSCCRPVVAMLPLALQTAGDAGDGLLIFGKDIATLQQWTLIYLGLSSLAFILVWVIGFLRR